MNRLDTTWLVETPEGIDLQAELAGPVPRCLAYLIDFSIRVLILIVVSLLLGFAGEAGWGIFLIISFLLEWFYPVVFEVYSRGQTPGKKRMGLAVVNEDLTPVGWSGAMVRNLLRWVDFLPFAYFFGLLSMVLSKRFQRLGDLAVGTIVIYRQTESGENNLPDLRPLAPSVPLTADDRAAIVGFTERDSELTQDRKQELADILEDFAHKNPAKRVESIHRMGAWILGSK